MSINQFHFGKGRFIKGDKFSKSNVQVKTDDGDLVAGNHINGDSVAGDQVFVKGNLFRSDNKKKAKKCENCGSNCFTKGKCDHCGTEYVKQHNHHTTNSHATNSVKDKVIDGNGVKVDVAENMTFRGNNIKVGKAINCTFQGNKNKVLEAIGCTFQGNNNKVSSHKNCTFQGNGNRI